MAYSPIEAFDHILNHLKKEDYDRCAASALQFVNRYKGHEDQSYRLRYARFFKLFADTYHAWQGSYHYTPIQGNFRKASNSLRQWLKEFSPPRHPPKDHVVVVRGLETLCNMLVEYTKCENSAINNDPFDLIIHSQAAIDLENVGRDGLDDFSGKEEYLIGIVQWLRDYFEKNLYLHTGLNACAHIYASIMRDRACPEAVFHDLMGRAEEALDKLTLLSPELSSELRAHIRHVRQHYERLMPQPEVPTFLRVRSGKLVLSLSAACDRAKTRRLLRVDRTEPRSVFDSFKHRALKVLGRNRKDPDGVGKSFKDAVIREFGKLGFVVDTDSFRPTQLMDIFETSFGENFLKSLTFDVGHAPLKLTFLDDRRSDPDPRQFEFDIHITLSALGACTVAFEMEIDDEGLSVEEIRALESCICPHAGQVQLEIERTGKSFASPARFLDRVDLAALHESIRVLDKTPNKKSEFKKSIEAVEKEIGDYHDHTENEAHGMTASDRLKRSKNLCAVVNSVIECVTDSTQLGELMACCHSHNRLAEFAEELLGAIEQAFRAAIKLDRRKEQEALAEDEVWNFRPDLGWYAYLYATRIDEVTTELTPVREAAPFNDIQEHPDTLGLVIDQREARASFDDWRFMTLKTSSEDNLAHVRSHAADAFYTSEFQTFFYFPDDPQYLVDQYEATVELILRLNVGLRFYNTMAENLTHQIRQDEATSASRWIRRIGDLERDLRRIRHLRVEANELRNLVFKAGISRYQDHGKLMKRILEQMNVETVAVLADRHLGHLEDLSQEIIERLRSTRVKVLSFVGILVSSLVGASVTKDFFDAGSHFYDHPSTFIAMAIVLGTSLIGGGILWILGKPPSEK